MAAERSEVFEMMDFPHLAARDLEGRAVSLPDDLDGQHKLVIVAFRREQQPVVDSWIAWHESIATDHPTLRCYELPVIATRWSPARKFIDGGMARAVRERDARRRTLTVYTDVRRVTDALAIDDTSVVTVLLLDPDGRVRWRTTGSATAEAGSGVLNALAEARSTDMSDAREMIEQFAFGFDRQFRPVLALAGITPGTAHVTLTQDLILIRFGPWSCETALTNVRDVRRTGPYDWYRAIGPRGSFADRGVTLGTTTSGGVCLMLHERVAGLLPFGALRHPGITIKLAEPDRFVASLRRRIGLA